MGMEGHRSGAKRRAAPSGRDPISGDRVGPGGGVLDGLRREVMRLTSGQRWTTSIGLVGLVLFLAAGLPSARVVTDAPIVGSLGDVASVETPGPGAATASTAAPPPLPAPRITAAPRPAVTGGPDSAPSLPGRPTGGDAGDGSPRPGPSAPRPDGDPCTDVTDYELALACVSHLVPGGLPPLPVPVPVPLP